ncbi:MAG: GNAT family N-acetyltransferase [Candidatus Hodarchaeota archaeon]
MMNERSSVSGFSTETLIHEIEFNFWETWSNFGLAPGCALHDDGDALWFETPIPIIPYNVILKFQMERNINQKIDEIISRYTRRKVSFVWVVQPSSLPLDIGDRLQKRGLIHIETIPCMARNLKDLPQVPSLPDGIEVYEAIEESDVNKFLELTAWRWGVPLDYHQKLQLIFQSFKIGKPGAKAHMWVAWRDGVPISKAGSYYGEGSVGVYGVATKPEERGQGLASVLMVETMKAAKQAGHKLVVLHSSPLAENLYKRLGFVTIAQFHLYASESTYL